MVLGKATCETAGGGKEEAGGKAMQWLVHTCRVWQLTLQEHGGACPWLCAAKQQHCACVG